MFHLKAFLVSATVASSCSIFASAFAFQPPKTQRCAHDSSTGVASCRADTSLLAKKILLAFDGTGTNARDFQPNAETDKTFTNVLKLHLLAGGDINNRRNDIDGQVCLYERGVGGVTDNKYIKKLQKTGGDLSRQIKPMREKLEGVYEPGDKLYLIGFSRGASAARKFAVQLHEEGLTTKNHGKVDEVPIEFLGCFDTVSMQVKKRLFKILKTKLKQGVTPSTVLGEKGTVAPNVNQAVHNLALDDNRQWHFPPFPPVNMGNEDRVSETWFPGVHDDVGGSRYTKGIPDGSCVHMKEWMEKSGLDFIKAVDINEECLKIDDYPDVKIEASDLTLHPDPSDKLHFEESQLSEPSYRLVHRVEGDKPVEGGIVQIHFSVLKHMEAMKEKGTPYPVNPNLKAANFVVVGSLGKVMDDETKRLAALLESDY
mmetsp:Transcript_4592/g.6780  ORF Transcript_4592/g.6780 Transcript_4592/m.6780 type:complete len:427 (+) Transcript_4592:160-1440(+)